MDDKYILLEQYRIYSEAKDRFIDRTFLVNRFYIVFSAVLFLSMITIKSIFVDAYALLLGIEFFGLAVCFSWVSRINGFCNLLNDNVFVENDVRDALAYGETDGERVP